MTARNCAGLFESTTMPISEENSLLDLGCYVQVGLAIFFKQPQEELLHQRRDMASRPRKGSSMIII